jgi:hypothetical protein
MEPPNPGSFCALRLGPSAGGVTPRKQMIAAEQRCGFAGDFCGGPNAGPKLVTLKKCCLFSNSISFILPKSFNKDSMKKSFGKHYHLIYEIDLLENSFLVLSLIHI